MNIQQLIITFVKRKLIIISLIAIIVILLFQSSYAQTAGDYQAYRSGKWDSTGVWQQYSGAAWVNTIVPPSFSSGVITIPFGITMTLNVQAVLDQMVVSGTVSINAGDSLTIVNGAGNDLTLVGTINGAGNIFISSLATADFQNGTIGGTGFLNIASGGTASMSNSTVVFDRTVNNSGTFNWNNGTINGAGTFNNNNILNIQTSFGASFNPTFNNTGTVTKSSTNTQNIFFGSFQNSTVINIQTGNLTMSQSSGSPTINGTFNISAGATLQFGNNGFITYTVNSSISGAGNVSSYTTAVNFSAACIYNITGNTNPLTGIMTFTPGMTLTNIGSMVLGGGNITLPSGLTVGAYGQVLTIGGGGTLILNTGKTFNFQKVSVLGTITGTDSIFVSDSLSLSSGSLTGTGGIKLNPGGVCVIFNNGITCDRNFINNGTINWIANSISGSGTILNNFIINISGTANTTYVGIINNGTVNKSSNTITQILGNFTNNIGAVYNITSGTLMPSVATGTYSVAGNINVSSGCFLQLGNTSNSTFNITGNISGAGSLTGSTTNINFLSGSVYNITGGTSVNNGILTFNSGGTITNIGNLSTAGGTINLQVGVIVTAIGSSLSLTGGGIINFNSGQKFQFTSITTNGTINGSDTISLNGNMTVTGGNFTGTGPFNFLSGSVVDISFNAFGVTKTINNSGTINWTAGTISNAGVINNNNIFNIQTATVSSCSASINNSGTINKSSNNLTQFTNGYNNLIGGAVNITAGTIMVSVNSGTFSIAGSVSISSGAFFQLGNSSVATYNISGSISGAGTFTSYTTAINFLAGSVYNISGTTAGTSGTVNFISSMTLTNVGIINISGVTLNFPAGLTIGSIGNTLTCSTGAVNFSTGKTYTFDRIDLGGAIGGSDSVFINTIFNWTNGTINSPSIVNLKSGGTCTVNSNTVSVVGTFINNGTVNWSQSNFSGAGTFINNNILNANPTNAYSFQPAVINNGTINKTTANINSFIGNFTNNSIVNISSGGVSVTNGTNYGTFNLSGNTTLSENNGTYVNLGTIVIPSNSFLTGNGTFTVNSLNFVNDGTVSVSTLQFDSITTLSGSGVINTTANFLNGCNVTLGSNVQFKGITVNSGGVFNLNGFKALINGSGQTLFNSGTLNMNNSTIEFNGSAAQSVTTSGITYKNLFINNPIGVTVPNGTLNVNDTLKIVSGFLNVANFSVLLGSTGYLVESNGAVVKGTTGTISTTRTVTSPNNLNVAGLGATITSVSDLGNTTITRGFSTYTINGSGSVLRYYNISPANNSGLNATLNYHFDNLELNGLNKNLLSLFRSTNAGTNWSLIGGAKDTANNNITFSGINAFSYWTAGNNPLAVSINFTVIVDGLYNTSTGKLNKKDTATIYIRNSGAPYSILDSAKILIDSNSFSGTAFFNTLPSGTYYYSIKYRNALETWTKSGGETYTTGTSMAYDFTSAQSQSYGNSTILKSGKYCIISGDLNQDGFVNGNDFTLFSQQFGQSGYLSADLNGDNVVNGNDFTTFSSSFGKQSNHP